MRGRSLFSIACDVQNLPAAVGGAYHEVVGAISPWNRIILPNYEVHLRFQYAEEYKNVLVNYSFGMRLRENCWDENLLKAAGFYVAYDPNIEELSLIWRQLSREGKTLAQKEIVSVNDHNREGRSKKPEDRPSSEKMDTILSERIQYCERGGMTWDKHENIENFQESVTGFQGPVKMSRARKIQEKTQRNKLGRVEAIKRRRLNPCRVVVLQKQILPDLDLIWWVN
ncbi:hypothetical protein M9H77_07141 [Catharanthus roseus]|uniref:Uncharacterized protein n=1 Tax=Catharanthus roseus TaxID=4058 RepID=A0ACC0BU79_CATRO|nr:hypothetical protein M9H77_07141 [Catharanthus roseus]